jgi:chromosome partitioning protein
MNRAQRRAAKKYSVVGYKGGIGKSTTTSNIADLLTYFFQKRVLCIDGDPQADLTKLMLGTMPEDTVIKKTLRHYFTEPTTTLKRIIYTNKYGVDLIPSDSLLDGVDRSMQARDVPHLFEEMIDELLPLYDYIFFDTRGAGSRLTQAVLAISDNVVIPMQAQFLAMEDTIMTMVDIEKWRLSNEQLDVVGILPTMIEQTIASRTVLEMMYNTFQKLEEQANIQLKEEDIHIEKDYYAGRILPIQIKRNTMHQQASGLGMPIRPYIQALSKYDKKAGENAMMGYYQVAQMIAYDVPRDLYLPEKKEQLDLFITQKEAIDNEQTQEA